MNEPEQTTAWVWVSKPDVFVVPILPPDLPERWLNAILGQDAMLRCLGTRPSGVACQRVMHRWHAWFRMDTPFSEYCAAHRPSPDQVWQFWGANETIRCPCGCEAQAHVFGRTLGTRDAPIDAVFHRIIRTLGREQWRTHESQWSVVGTHDTDIEWVPRIATNVPPLADAYRAWLFEGPSGYWDVGDHSDL